MLNIPQRTAQVYISFAKISNKEKFVEYQVGIMHAEKILALKNYVAELKKTILGEPFNATEQRKFERVILEQIKDGAIINSRDYAKLKDTFKTNPKLIDKFMEGNATVSDLFSKSNAKSAYHLRNALNSAGYVSGHIGSLISDGKVSLSQADKERFKQTLATIKKLLELAG